MIKNKVFCLGFHKTGTTSLAEALKQLGYRVTGPNGVNDPNIEKNVLPMAYDLIEKFDAFQDNPWPIIYKKIDKNYPDSKYILLLRNSDAWIKSIINHFGQEKTPMREWIYGVGCPEGNEEIYINRFEKHNADVLNYFKNRPEDLLVMELAKGDGWEKLCKFLEKDIPLKPFPHEQKAADREKKLKDKNSQKYFLSYKNIVKKIRKQFK